MICPKNYLTIWDIKKTEEFYGGEDLKRKYKENSSYKKIKEKWYEKIKDYSTKPSKNEQRKNEKFLDNLEKYKRTLKN